MARLLDPSARPEDEYDRDRHAHRERARDGRAWDLETTDHDADDPPRWLTECPTEPRKKSPTLRQRRPRPAP